VSCSELSSAEPLAGTATVATRFLLLEHRGRWGRDAVDDTMHPPEVRVYAEAFEGRVLLIRRPGSNDAALAAYEAEVLPEGGTLRRLARPGDRAGDALAGQLLLVCTHGRRDACCARLGVPLHDALAPHVDEDRLWQSSHHGGHRFAANLLALPSGVQLGRVPPSEAAAVASQLATGRIPLGWYRGRTLDSSRCQAADAEVRRTLGLDRIADVRPVGDDGRTIEVAVPEGVVHVRVEETDGPLLPPSCGAEPEPSRRFVAHVESRKGRW
jgi:hypothetical protein